MKKKIFLLLISIIFASFLGFHHVQAQGNAQTEIEKQMQAFAGKDGAQFGNPTDPRIIVARIIKLFLTFVGTLAVVYTMYGGYLYMTSGGVEDRITKARRIILYGAIGGMIILMAYSFAFFVYYIMYRGTTMNPFSGSSSGVGIKPDTGQLYNQDPAEQTNIPDNWQLQNIIND